MDSFNVKDNYSNKQKKRAALNDKMKDLKKNDKKVMSTGSGSIDWNGAVFIFGRIDPRNYLLSADLGLSMMWSGSLQYTAYMLVGPVPLYVGITAAADGGGTAVVGFKTPALFSFSQYQLSNEASLTLNLAIMLEAVIGAGLRGILGLEGFANANLGGTLALTNSADKPGRNPVRFQIGAGVNAGLRARLFFITYTKSWEILDKTLYDSWGVYDSEDPGSPSPYALAAAGSGEELPQYSVLLADPEVRAAAADASNQEYGAYAESLEGIEPEVSIAEDGTQEDLRADEPMLLANETAEQSAVTGISTMEKTQVLTGSDFQYIASDDCSYLFRIATVYDKNMGGNVARVVYSEGDKNGQSSKTIALPSTRERSTYYGYDTNFAVTMSANESNIAYVAIVSAPSAPAKDAADIAKQAAESRLRVLRINLDTGKVLGNVLMPNLKTVRHTANRADMQQISKQTEI